VLRKARNRLSPLIEKIAPRVDPNVITLSSLIPTSLAVLAALTHSHYLASVLILLSGFLDVLDGITARKYGRVSTKGAFLDSVVDRYNDFMAILILPILDSRTWFWAFLGLLGSQLTSYARARGESLGVPMAGVGLFERAERLIFLAVIISLGKLLGNDFLLVGSGVFAVITNVAALWRIFYFVKRATSSPP